MCNEGAMGGVWRCKITDKDKALFATKQNHKHNFDKRLLQMARFHFLREPCK
jgi:hypothetical protein